MRSARRRSKTYAAAVLALVLVCLTLTATFFPNWPVQADHAVIPTAGGVLASISTTGNGRELISTAQVNRESISTTGNGRAVDLMSPHIRQAIHYADVIIDAGHGGIDGGTNWGTIKESHINLAIGRKLYLLLKSRGVRAILNRTGDYALSDDNRWHKARSRHQRDLTQRRGLQDEVAASMLVSIHVNWAPRGGQRGPLVIYRKGDDQSALLALHLQNSLNRQQGIRHRKPRSSDRYYLLNLAKIPSVIVETAFLSDPRDRAMLTSLRGQTMVAEAIATGIVAYLALTPEPAPR